MKNSYQQVQSLISVTSEMEQRILARLTEESKHEVRSNRKTIFRLPKKFVLPLVVCCALITIIVVMPSLKTIPDFTSTPEASNPPDFTTPPVENGSPVVDYTNLNELAQNLPYQLYTLSELPQGYSFDMSTIFNGEIAQLTYLDQTNHTDNITFRMAQGTEDISGDYNSYEQIETMTTKLGDVTLKGQDGRVSLATWTTNDHFFSISSSKPISKDMMIQLVQGVVPYS